MRRFDWCAGVLIAMALVSRATGAETESLRDQVFATERAFAQSMADRDHAAFVGFLSEEAVFFSGPTVMRGKQAVADAWQRFYDGPQAPFSWVPATVEVLDSGTLALSSGPVFDAERQCVGTFTSIWRRELPGAWRIVFDKGSADCPAPAP
jgi:ketosteroid isomerase-like protein